MKPRRVAGPRSGPTWPVTGLEGGPAQTPTPAQAWKAEAELWSSGPKNQRWGGRAGVLVGGVFLRQYKHIRKLSHSLAKVLTWFTGFLPAMSGNPQAHPALQDSALPSQSHSPQQQLPFDAQLTSPAPAHQAHERFLLPLQEVTVRTRTKQPKCKQFLSKGNVTT